MIIDSTSIGLLTLSASHHGPLVSVTVYHGVEQRGHMLLSVDEWSSLCAQRDVMVAADKEIERLRAGLIPAESIPDHIRQFAIAGLERDIALTRTDELESALREACDIAARADLDSTYESIARLRLIAKGSGTDE